MKIKIVKNKIEIEVTDEEKELILKNGLNELLNSNKPKPYPIYINGQDIDFTKVNSPDKPNKQVICG